MRNVHKHKYTWKCGTEWVPDVVGFETPLLEGMVFVDLLTGVAHKVHSVRKTADGEMIQTYSANALIEEELIAFRKKHSFQVDAFLRPNQIFQILE